MKLYAVGIEFADGRRVVDGFYADALVVYEFGVLRG